MKKILTVCTLLAVLIGLVVIAAPKPEAPRAIPTTIAPTVTTESAPAKISAADQAVAVKMEIEDLIARIIEAKASGQVPSPAWYARLAELQPRSETSGLDQGNDVCPGTVIPSLPYTDAGTTAGMTDDYNSPMCFIGSGSDVVYEYTATEDGDHTVSLCGSSFDTGLHVWTGGACPGTTEVACNDDYCGLSSQVTVAMTTGTTYYIVVDACCGGSGDYTLNVTAPAPPAPGKDCTDPVLISGVGAWSNTTCGMLDDYYLTCLASYDEGEDIIYAWTVTEAGDYSLALTSDASWVGIGVAATCPLPETGCIATATSSGANATIPCTNFAPGTYYIMIDTWPSPMCIPNFTLTITQCGAPLPGDVCATALALPVPGTVSGNTNDYNHDYDEVCFYSGSLSKDVAYVYAPIETELVTLSLCTGTTDYDSKLYVYDGVCDGDPVACNDDACSSPFYNDYVSRLDCVPLLGGHTYYVIVDGYGSNNGAYTLEATICEPCPPPPNDDCAAVTPAALPATFVGDNSCATPDCGFFPGQGNAWIAFEVPAACDVVLDYCGTSPAFGNAWLNLALGCPCTGYTPAGTYEFTSCGDENVTIRWTGLAPGIYYYPVLRVDGIASGPYTINVHCEAPPPCNDFVLFAPGGMSGSTTGAGDNCTLNPGPEQIVEVHIPYTGMWTFSLCHPGTMYDTWLDLYSGCCGGELIAWNDDYCGLVSELPHVPLDAGTYYLAIEGYSTNAGPWELTVTACRQRVDFDPLIIPQSVCVTLNFAEHTDLVIGGQPGQPPLNPYMAPIVTVQPGCDPEFTYCDDPDCPPFTGFIDILWIYVADSVIMCDCGWPDCNCAPVIIHGGWYAVIMNMDDLVGCICITFEGFFAVELNSFSAIGHDGSVDVTWSTASETNNDRFDVLRDGETVAQVPTLGNGPEGHAYTWTDRDVTNGTTYTYSLVSVDINGVREELATYEATPSTGAAVVTEYALHQNYPNPFNPGTTISFDLVETGNVTLAVYNLMGQEVVSLVKGEMSAGRHTVNFTATNLPSGVYLYKLNVNGFSANMKMVLMK